MLSLITLISLASAARPIDVHVVNDNDVTIKPTVITGEGSLAGR